MKVVGLTGGIGSGKSTVLNFFKKLGVFVYSADKSAKNLINTDKNLIKLIKDSFGSNIYNNNTLDSKLLSKIVFNDSKKLNILNSIVHPAVEKDFQTFLSQVEGCYVVKEAAIIFEIGSENNYDSIILVKSPIEDRIKRVIKRDEISRAEVLRIIDNQIDESLISEKCDYIINNIDIKFLKKEVLDIHHKLKC